MFCSMILRSPGSTLFPYTTLFRSWPGTGLGREQDPRLLAATERRRGRGHQGAEEGVQATGGDARVPGVQRRLDRRDQPLGVPSRQGREVHPRGPGDMAEVTLDLPL